MRQMRWVGWTMAIATTVVLSGGRTVRADVASDKPAAILVYPQVVVDSDLEVSNSDIAAKRDTVIRLTNTNSTSPVNVHCFYINANSHCSGGSADGAICNSSAGICTGGGVCTAGWQETDFDITLTPQQPVEWQASNGFSGSDLPLPYGRCKLNPFQACGVDADCSPFPGGPCTLSNSGTNVPPVPEDPFRGELKCIEVDANQTPVAQNDLKGEGILENFVRDQDTPASDFDVASYNAIGIQSTGAAVTGNELTLGSGGQYNGCPNVLILDHFFDGARDPVPGSDNVITTNIVLVPCSEDFLRQIPGSATVQYLVFNEFEQRFSTSKSVNCYADQPISRIDTTNPSRSIFSAGVAGTLSGQTRLNPIGTGTLPSGLLGIAVEQHQSESFARTAAFNLNMAGARSSADTITLP